MDLSDLVFARIVARLAEEEPDRLVVVFEHGPGAAERVHARDLDVHGNQIAWLLAQDGIGPGDRVGIQMRNHPEFLFALVGLSKLGAIAVPIDPRATGDALTYYLDRVGCSATLVTDTILADEAAASALRLPDVRVYAVETPEGRAAGVDAAGYASATEAILGPERPDAGQHVIDASEPWMLQFTSGTTGNAKPIVMTYLATAHYRATPAALGYRSDDVPYTGLPLVHGNARGNTVYPSIFRMTDHSVVSRWFTASRIWDICIEHRCTTWSNLGGIATAVYAQPSSPNDRRHPVRLVVNSGMSHELREPFMERFGVELVDNYGTMEAGVIAVKPPGQGPLEAVGRPLGDRRLEILDEEDEPLPAGHIGQIAIRAEDDRSRLRYWDDPVATAQKLRNGWLLTGDIGWRDEDGWLYFSHRGEEGGIRKLGEFVPVDAIVRVLAELPGVDDVCVYGIDAASGAPGEKDVVAAIVPGRRNDFHADAVFARCAETLKRSARPDMLQVVDELPKTPTQKVRLVELEALLRDHPEDVFRNPDTR